MNEVKSEKPREKKTEHLNYDSRKQIFNIGFHGTVLVGCSPDMAQRT